MGGKKDDNDVISMFEVCDVLDSCISCSGVGVKNGRPQILAG